MLLEKAYAKVCGGYNNLTIGYCEEAQTLLTGAPTCMYWCTLGDEEKWTILYNADKSHFIMTCVSHASTTSEVNPIDPKVVIMWLSSAINCAIKCAL